MESREKSPSCREKQPRATESANTASWAQEEVPRRTKGPKNQPSQGPPGRLSWLNVGRAQRKSSAPTAAHPAGWDGGQHTSLESLGPDVRQAEGRTDAPTFSHFYRHSERLGRWEKTGKASVLRVGGQGVGGSPCFPLPWVGRRALGGRQRPWGSGSCRDTSRAGGWGGGGKGPREPPGTRA